MPSQGSCIFTYLQMIKDEMERNIAQQKSHCFQFWYPPKEDSVQKKSESPELWYLGNVWVFAWLPILQFKHMGLSTQCHSKCKKWNCSSQLVSMGYFWRLMLELNRVTWVLYCQFQFKNCKHNIAAIDPCLLSQMPTKMLNAFPLLLVRKVIEFTNISYIYSCH